MQGAKEQIARWRKWLNPAQQHEAAFYGGSFTGLDIGLQQELLALTDKLYHEGVIHSVRLSTRPDYINREELQLLQEHHVRLVELGVQSLDDEVLRLAERGHTAMQVNVAMTLLKEYGFKTGIQLMVGMPGQSFDSVCKTAQQVVDLTPAIARIYPLLVIQGTPLASSFTKGQFIPLTLEEAVEQASYVYTLLTEHGINVIRIGLQPDAELCTEGNILGGPFHPAMGELVKSRALRNRITPRLVELYNIGQHKLQLIYPISWESKIRGQKNSNINYWQEQLAGLELHLVPQAEVVQEEVSVWQNVNHLRP